MKLVVTEKNDAATKIASLLGAGKPLLVGVPTLGALLAVAGYFIVLGLWRLNTARQWQRRKAGRE